MQLAEVVQLLKNSEISLFLGAGVSVPGGGPTGQQLLQSVKAKYPVICEERDFFKAFDTILLSDNANRGEVEDFVKSTLASVTPTTDSHSGGHN